MNLFFDVCLLGLTFISDFWMAFPSLPQSALNLFLVLEPSQADIEQETVFALWLTGCQSMNKDQKN